MPEAFSLFNERKYGDLFHKLLRKFSKFTAGLFFYDRFFIIRRPLSPVARASDRVRLAGENDLEPLEAFAPRHGKHEDRLKCGDQCLVINAQDRIAGMQWIKRSRFHREEESGYSVLLPVHGVWTYDTKVDEEYRYRGVWIDLKNFESDFLRQKGVTHAFCLVNRGNTLSLQSHLRMSAQILEEVIMLKVPGMLVCFKKGFLANEPSGHWRIDRKAMGVYD